MSKLKNIEAEEDALFIAQTLLRYGKKLALVKLHSIAKTKSLKNWEASILSRRILELAKRYTWLNIKK